MTLALVLFEISTFKVSPVKPCPPYKSLLIVFFAWFGFVEIKFYLIDLFLFDENHQKPIDIGLAIMHLGLYSGFSFYANLQKNIGLLESFGFLQIPHQKDPYRYAQRYHLDKQSTKQFLVAYRLACLFLKLFSPAYILFVMAATLRCFCHSFHLVSLTYFLGVNLLLTLITLVGYLMLALYIISKFFLVVFSSQFLILRIKSMNAMLGLIKTRLASDTRLRLRKERVNSLKVLRLLNDFCRQFKKISFVLDSSISLMMLGAFIVLYLIPFFMVFVEIPLAIRLLLFVLIPANYLFCFSFSFCNDRMPRQVGLVICYCRL